MPCREMRAARQRRKATKCPYSFVALTISSAVAHLSFPGHDAMPTQSCAEARRDDADAIRYAGMMRQHIQARRLPERATLAGHDAADAESGSLLTAWIRQRAPVSRDDDVRRLHKITGR